MGPGRPAYSEVLPDEKGATCTGFIARAADYFAAHGILAIERVMTGNRCRWVGLPWVDTGAQRE